MDFYLNAPYKPAGDQPEAIKSLVRGVNEGDTYQTLLGVTGSGKTFTIANVIAETNRPTLILSHNKTLAAQLYGEFKAFFPNNAVEYFISYYDYYQPEAYIPSSGTYIEKDLSINEQIERLRLRATSALASGRRDVIVVSSVSCIYGMGNPDEFGNSVIRVAKGLNIPLRRLMYSFTELLYSKVPFPNRNDKAKAGAEPVFKPGTFRATGDLIEIFPGAMEWAYRIEFEFDEIARITKIDPETGKTINEEFSFNLYPATLFVSGRETMNKAINDIQADLVEQIKFFEREMRLQEAQRIKERTEFDLEMMRELGYCSGIENYGRYFDGRKPGQRPFCLLDYFPEDYLLVVDESHVTLPQVRAMWAGDRHRKENLVEYGFRLPAALDNRPLKFEEFEEKTNQIIYVSATPADYELRKTDGVVVEQIVRPTGLLDPLIDVRPTKGQIDDLLTEIHTVIDRGERVLITTLTKRMAEEFAQFFVEKGVKTRYLHSGIESLERIDILNDLRSGVFDVLIGVNLLREGLDLPEVSLVAIMDADKEGFLRDSRSMIQTIGRAARNAEGKVIMYADKITDSMARAIEETKRRRKKQEDYNTANNITPRTIRKTTPFGGIEAKSGKYDAKEVKTPIYAMEESNVMPLAADPVIEYLSVKALKKLADETQKRMLEAAKNEEFLLAARLRDEWLLLKKKIEQAESEL